MTNAPEFMNAASGDYRLVPGSPCIDAGMALSSVTNDFDGIPRPLDGNADGTSRWDIGAYEYVHPAADSDHDGLTDTNELSITGTSPIKADTDGDRLDDGDELVADTDPLDAESLLAIRGICLQAGGVRIDWQGGRDAWQYLECRDRIATTGDQWTAQLAIPPPTPVTNAIIDLGATNRTLFYRIRVER